MAGNLDKKKCNAHEFADFTILCLPGDTRANFEVYMLAGTTTDGKRLYGEDSMPEMSSPDIHGYIKWDSCSEWEGLDGHYCGISDFEVSAASLAECWKIARSCFKSPLDGDELWIRKQGE